MRPELRLLLVLSVSAAFAGAYACSNGTFNDALPFYDPDGGASMSEDSSVPADAADAQGPADAGDAASAKDGGDAGDAGDGGGATDGSATDAGDAGPSDDGSVDDASNLDGANEAG